MSHFLLSILKSLAVFSVMLLFYPFVAVMDLAGLGYVATDISFYHFCQVAGLGLLGTLLAYIFERRGTAYRLITKILLLGLPFLCAISLVLFFTGITVLNCFLVVLSFAAYITGSTLASRAVDEIIDTRIFIAGLILYPAAMGIIWFFGLYFSLSYTPFLLILFFLLFILICAIISNQTNINRMMDRRRYRRSSLPKNARIYNIVLICAGFLLIVSSLLFKEFAWFLLELFIQVVYSIGAAFIFLFNLFLVFVTQEKDIEEVLPPPTRGQSIIGMVQSGEIPYIGQIVTGVLIVAAAAFLIAKRKQIFRLIARIVLAVINGVKRLFTRQSAAERPAVVTQSFEYYSDTLEDLEKNGDEYSLFDEDEKANSLRQWRQQYRHFSRQKKPAVDQVKEGYRLVLQWLRLYGVPIEPADTTLEILNKALARVPLPDLQTATHVYNDGYYGGLVLTEGNSESLMQTLAALAKIR